MGIVKNNDETIWLNVTTAPLPLKSKGVFVTYNDITERKAAEDLLIQKATQLRLLTDALPLLISYVDLNGNHSFYNKAYSDWFGISQDQLIGRSVQGVLGGSVFSESQPFWSVPASHVS